MFGDPLRDCVGPAPWYWTTFPNVDDAYEWRLVRDRPTLFRDDIALLQVLIYGRVLAADPGTVLLWGPASDRRGVIIAETFAVASLLPLEEGRSASGGAPWVVSVHPVDHVQIPQGLPAGRADRRYPARAASTLDEVLLLADGPDDGTPTAASIYSWRPGDGLVDVIPQPWFNSNDNDIGYEWITRVRRDPKSRHIVGDGIRIPPFELDEHGTWLRRRGPPVPSV